MVTEIVTKAVTKGLGLALLLGVAIALPACNFGGERQLEAQPEGAEETETDDDEDDNNQTEQEDDD